MGKLSLIKKSSKDIISHLFHFNRIIHVTPNGVVDRMDTTYEEFLDNKDVQDRIQKLYAE